MGIERLKYPSLVLGAGFGLGIVADLLMNGKAVGISFLLVIIFLLLAMVALAKIEHKSIIYSNQWLVMMILYLAVMSFVRAAPFVRFLNISGAILLTALLAVRLIAGPVTDLNLGRMTLSLFEMTVISLISPAPLTARTAKEVFRKDSGRRVLVRQVSLGLFIAAPFMCVFTGLFASGDLLFSKLIQDLLKELKPGNVISHIFSAGVLSWVFSGVLLYTVTREQGWQSFLISRSSDDEDDSDKPRHIKFPRLGIVEASVVLICLNLLFAAFLAVQAAALFGGEAFLQRQGLTYSEYARSGFFQLLAVAIITLILILSLDFLTQRATSRSQIVFLSGSAAIISMTIIILVSAFQRLSLYEATFGFTRLRVHSHVLIVWIAVLLAAVLILLFTRRTAVFATVLVVAAFGFTVTLNALNPDRFIVQRNLSRYQQGEELDVAYLSSLSEDAVPYLIPLLYDYSAEIGEEIGPWLRMHLVTLDERAEDATWASYHTAYARSHRALSVNRGLIERFDASNIRPNYRLSP